MDPAHNSERWNMFTGFCINTDVEKTMGKGVIVPDEHFNQLKYSLWFDDFSPGCGACDKTAHVFKDCLHKNPPIPTLHITLKKPPSKNRSEEENYLNATNQEDWKQVGKNNKVIEPHPSFQLPSNNFYLSDRGGVEILCESEESDEGIQSFFQESEPVNIQENLISVAADLHPYNLMSENNNIQKAGNSGGGVPKNPHSPIKTSENNQDIKSNNFKGESSKVQEESSYDKNKVPETKSSLTDNQISPPPPESNNLNKSTQEQWPAEVLEDYEDEQFDYEYD